MKAQQAIELAKRAVMDFFGQEGVGNVQLEEIYKNDPGDAWLITVSFTRASLLPQGALAGYAIDSKRYYKVVSISDVDGAILAVRTRDD